MAAYLSNKHFTKKLTTISLTLLRQRPGTKAMCFARQYITIKAASQMVIARWRHWCSIDVVKGKSFKN